MSKHILPTDVEALFIELSFRKCKWLLIGNYHPPPLSDQYFFDKFVNVLDLCSNYEFHLFFSW